MTKFIVRPEDDPNAAQGEVEIIASALNAKGKLLQVLCRVVTNSDSLKAREIVRIAFSKQGYKLWHHGRIQSVLTDDKGNHYVTGTFEKI